MEAALELGRGLKNVELHAKNGLLYQEWNFNGNSGEGLEQKKQERKPPSCEHLSNHVHNVGKDMDVKGHSDEVSDGNGECVVGQ